MVSWVRPSTPHTPLLPPPSQPLCPEGLAPLCLLPYWSSLLATSHPSPFPSSQSPARVCGTHRGRGMEAAFFLRLFYWWHAQECSGDKRECRILNLDLVQDTYSAEGGQPVDTAPHTAQSPLPPTHAPHDTRLVLTCSAPPCRCLAPAFPPPSQPPAPSLSPPSPPGCSEASAVAAAAVAVGDTQTGGVGFSVWAVLGLEGGHLGSEARAPR